MKTKLFLATAVAFGINTFAQTFTPMANLPIAGKSRAVAFSIGKHGYYGSGNDKGGAGETGTFYKYDPSLNKWQSIAPMPMGMQAAIGFSIGNFGYAGIGWQGGNGKTNFYKYDPNTNTWSSAANFNGKPINDAAGFSDEYGRKGYVACGAQPYSTASTQFFQYDPNTNAWKSVANFPGGARRNPAGVSGTNGIYVGGGQTDPFTSNYNDFYNYDVFQNKWNAITSCPANLVSQMGATRNSAFVLKEKMYLCLQSEMWVYDIQKNSWSQAAGYPITGGVDGVFKIGDKAYIIENNSNKFWEFLPAAAEAKTVIAIFKDYTMPEGDDNFTLLDEHGKLISIGAFYHDNTTTPSDLLTPEFNLNSKYKGKKGKIFYVEKGNPGMLLIQKVEWIK